MIKDCQIPTRSFLYEGVVSRTVSGRVCQRWDTQQPHAHDYDTFADGSITQAANHCRNPDPQWPYGIWCLTEDPTKRWEACDVPYCGELNLTISLEKSYIYFHFRVEM